MAKSHSVSIDAKLRKISAFTKLCNFSIPTYKNAGCPSCGKRFSHSGTFSSHMSSKKCRSMNPNMPIKSRTRRNIRGQVEQQEGQQSNLHLPINHRHQSFTIKTSTEHETHHHQNHHHHYRLMEQPQQQQHQKQQKQTPSHETEQMYVLDLSLKNKKNINDDVETRSMSDDDVKIQNSSSHQLPHPLQSLLGGFNKPLYTSNDMTMFWNMLMHFSFNNYQNYFSQFKDNNNVNVDVLKGRY